jgi:hypothetical protein
VFAVSGDIQCCSNRVDGVFVCMKAVLEKLYLRPLKETLYVVTAEGEDTFVARTEKSAMDHMGNMHGGYHDRTFGPYEHSDIVTVWWRDDCDDLIEFKLIPTEVY